MEVGDDLSRNVYYDENVQGEVLRVHYRIYRSPSKRTYRLRHLHDATDAERAQAMKDFHNLHELFDSLEAMGHAFRHLNRRDRTWFFVIGMGTPVEDPLIQLELEMMIDLTQKASV